MAEISKLEVEGDATCNADKFFNLIKFSLHHLPTIFPESYKSSDIIKGDGNSVGTVRLWKYCLPGSSDVLESKEMIEEVDDEKRIMTMNITDGHLKDQYSHFIVKICVTPKGDGSVVKWIVEYNKADVGGPDPHHYLELFTQINEKIDAHLLKA